MFYSRYIFGPTPLFICNLNIFLKRTMTTQAMLFLDSIMLSRFIFIFVLRNPSAFQDDFWSLFGNIWLLAFSWIGQIVSEIMLGCENLNTNICSGKNIKIPKECLPATRNDRFNGIIACFTLVIHFFVLIRIQIFKRSKQANQHELSKKTKISLRNFRDSNLFLSLVQNTIKCILIIYVAVAPAIIKKFTIDNNHENLYDILNRLVRTPLFMLLLMINYYFFNRAVSNTIFRAFFDWTNLLKKWKSWMTQ